MADTKYLLIGGGLASSQAAKAIRMQDDDGAITLVSAEPHVPYDRPPLSKEFLQGKKARGELFYDSADTLGTKNVELELNNRVEKLDAQRQCITLETGGEISYEQVLIATGGSPVRLDLPGADLDGVRYLRTLDDAEALKTMAVEGAKGVIVGAGFIGMEVAASLTQRGVDITVLEMAPRVWARFADKTLSDFMEGYFVDKGVTFKTGATVTAFKGTEKLQAVELDGGHSLPCDFALVAVGIRPNVALAQEAGLEVANGIVVDRHMRTSNPSIYAAGDVANYPDPYFDKRRRVEHWGHAEYTGQIAGANMAGKDLEYGLLTYVWSDLFDLHLEFAGDETEFDRSEIRGSVSDARFTVLFLKDRRLTAYFAINEDPKEYAKFNKVIQKRGGLEDLE